VAVERVPSSARSPPPAVHMSDRSLVPSSVSRVLTSAMAIVVIAASTDCAAYPSSARDGLLSLSLSSAIAHATRDDILAGADGTYIDCLLADRDSVIERWPEHLATPLRVWIDGEDRPDGMNASYPIAVRSAFAEWATTGIPLRFAFVSSPHDADIRVRWTNHLDHKTGSTTWKTDRTGWMIVSEITLATHVSGGQALDARGMRAIALHEVGHALGLSHSTSPADIMAALVRVDGLSSPDRGTIKLLYSLPAGPVAR
jgi:Matrixin